MPIANSNVSKLSIIPVQAPKLLSYADVTRSSANERNRHQKVGQINRKALESIVTQHSPTVE